MNEQAIAPMCSWLIAPMGEAVSKAIQRLQRAPDVQRVAVMPDVHLAEDVCVGVAVGTTELLYPQAVGGDIGCGMLAVPFDVDAASMSEPRVAGRILAQLGNLIPARRRTRRRVIPMPGDLSNPVLSDPRLESLWKTTGALEFGTIGSGNHFVELQADESAGLWLMVHSGSRGLGPAIRDYHLARGTPVGGGLRCLNSREGTGTAYLRDAGLARRFAQENRRQIALLVEEVVLDAVGSGHLRWPEAITTDHNHVERETHAESTLWVHRKGAMPAWPGQRGVLPGSMGSLSYHVSGRGCADALCSSAHGAGRILSRADARRTISARDLRQQMGKVWYDFRQSERLRDEAPGAYKDIRAVARAQRDLVKVVRVLRPVLNYKGT
jgi:tRNA-splicing ligase RtcB (3'-phosphate/5'-hydroxy nucleic acid ligase)